MYRITESSKKFNLEIYECRNQSREWCSISNAISIFIPLGSKRGKGWWQCYYLDRATPVSSFRTLSGMHYWWYSVRNKETITLIPNSILRQWKNYFNFHCTPHCLLPPPFSCLSIPILRCLSLRSIHSIVSLYSRSPYLLSSPHHPKSSCSIISQRR